MLVDGLTENQQISKSTKYVTQTFFTAQISHATYKKEYLCFGTFHKQGGG